MLVINANPTQEIVTEADYILNQNPTVTPSPYSIGSYRHSWIDSTNKYMYFVYSMSSAPWFNIIRYSYATPGVLSDPVNLTLSWFGTFSSQPIFGAFQWSVDWNFYLMFTTTAWSWQPAILTVYGVTITWDTATLDAWNTLPVIASYSPSKVFANWTTIYAFYYLTASPYTMWDWVKRNWSSWDTLTGDALPWSLWTIQEWSSSRLFWGKYRWWILWWVNNDRFFGIFQTSDIVLYFDTSDDTWHITSIDRDLTNKISVDVNWYVMWSNGIFDNDLVVIWWWAYKWSLCESDITNWFLVNNYGSSINLCWSLVWTDKRIRRVVGNASTSWNNFILYSVDWGTTWKQLVYTSTLISDNYNLNIFGANMIVLAIYMSQASWLTVEVVS